MSLASKLFASRKTPHLAGVGTVKKHSLNATHKSLTPIFVQIPKNDINRPIQSEKKTELIELNSQSKKHINKSENDESNAKKVAYSVHFLSKENFRPSSFFRDFHTLNSSIIDPNFLNYRRKKIHFNHNQVGHNRSNFKSGAQGRVTFSTSGANSPLAVKEFFSEDQFLVEASASKLAEGSAHSCHLRDTGMHPDTSLPTIVMDKVGNKDLFQILDENKKGFSEKECLKLLKQCLEYLRDFQERGIVHSDLKPENIIYDEENDQYIIIDLGLSTIKSLSTYSQRTKGGTFAYASPELAMGLKSGFEQDIWSLGIVIFTAFSYKKLFHLVYKKGFKNANALVWEMEKIFGNIPSTMVGKMSVNDFRSYSFWLKVNEKRLKKLEPLIHSFDELIKDFPPSLKRILKRMCTYKNRPTAKDLLKDQIFKSDIGFKIDFPNNPKYFDLDLLITPKVKDVDQNLKETPLVFSLNTKRRKKLCHHVPSSYNNEYKVQLRDKAGEIVFEVDHFKLSQNGVLKIL